MENEKYKSGEFYKILPDSKVIIERTKLIAFWEARGYRKSLSDGGNYELVKISQGSIVEPARNFMLSQEVRKHLEKNNAIIVFEEFLRRDYASNILIKSLEGIHIDFSYDSPKESIFFYQNGVVKATPDNCRMISYEDYDGYLWKHQINPRNFNPVKDYQNAIFARFIFNICGKDFDRFSSLRSIIGYLLHSYKDASFSMAVIMLDEDLDLNQKEAKGGKGKSLFAQGIGKVVPYYFKNGKDLKKDNRFLFSGVERHHKVVFFDDVGKDFNFESLFSMITGDFSLEKKYKNEVVIPFSESPKILISSNYMIGGVQGYSTDRRKIEFEVAPHYGRHLTPIQEFNHRFFDDWDEEEWNRFDSFMMICSRDYLKEGVIITEPVNLTENRLKTETHSKFVEFIDQEIQTSGRYDKAELLDKFRDKYGNEVFKVSPNQFSKWLTIWANYRNHESQHRKSNSRQIFHVEFKKEENNI